MLAPRAVTSARGARERDEFARHACSRGEKTARQKKCARVRKSLTEFFPSFTFVMQKGGDSAMAKKAKKSSAKKKTTKKTTKKK